MSPATEKPRPLELQDLPYIPCGVQERLKELWKQHYQLYQLWAEKPVRQKLFKREEPNAITAQTSNLLMLIRDLSSLARENAIISEMQMSGVYDEILRLSRRPESERRQGVLILATFINCSCR